VTPAVVRSSARIFAALGDETRLAVVSRLCHRGPASLSALSEGAGVTRQAIAKHLAILADAGLVRGSREGRESIWELKPARLDAARTALEAISSQWDVALGRLKDLVED
jgi:DNA-binding transcriptional ArsR family regulator